MNAIRGALFAQVSHGIILNSIALRPFIHYLKCTYKLSFLTLNTGSQSTAEESNQNSENEG
mgnify:CR=1